MWRLQNGGSVEDSQMKGATKGNCLKYHTQHLQRVEEASGTLDSRLLLCTFSMWHSHSTKLEAHARDGNGREAHCNADEP